MITSADIDYKLEKGLDLREVLSKIIAHLGEVIERGDTNTVEVRAKISEKTLELLDISTLIQEEYELWEQQNATQN